MTKSCAYFAGHRIWLITIEMILWCLIKFFSEMEPLCDGLKSYQVISIKILLHMSFRQEYYRPPNHNIIQITDCTGLSVSYAFRNAYIKSDHNGTNFCSIRGLLDHSARWCRSILEIRQVFHNTWKALQMRYFLRWNKWKHAKTWLSDF